MRSCRNRLCVSVSLCVSLRSFLLMHQIGRNTVRDTEGNMEGVAAGVLITTDGCQPKGSRAELFNCLRQGHGQHTRQVAGFLPFSHACQVALITPSTERGNIQMTLAAHPAKHPATRLPISKRPTYSAMSEININILGIS